MTFANQSVQGSPFFTEVYDPSQVRIGPLPRDIMVGVENSFEIHLENAGNVPFEMKITSPTGMSGKGRFLFSLVLTFVSISSIQNG